MSSNWEEFYAKNPKPADLSKSENQLKNFVERHAKENVKVVLVTVSTQFIFFFFRFPSIS